MDWEYSTLESRDGQPDENGIFYTCMSDGRNMVAADPTQQNAMTVLSHLVSQGWEQLESNVVHCGHGLIRTWNLRRRRAA